MKKLFNKIVTNIIKLFKIKKIITKESEKLSLDVANWIGSDEDEIKKDIIDIEPCRGNLNKLKDSFNRAYFVSFIGAGTSKGTGIPLWADLISKLCKRAGIKFDKEMDNLLKKASEAKLALKKVGEINSYYKCLEDQIGKGIISGGTLFHTKVVEVFDRHITTNFDAKAYKQYYKAKLKLMDFQSVPKLNFEAFRKGHKPFVFLHGNIGVKFVILEEELYDHYYPNVSGEWGNTQIESFLEEVNRNFSIVFFGVSFQDKYLLKTFKKIADDLKISRERGGTSQDHFLIVDEDALGIDGFNLIDLKKKVEKINIERIGQKLLKEGYIDGQGNFRIQKFVEFLEYRDPDKSLEMYFQSFGRKISDWFERFQSMNIFPIIYKKGAHRFAENILSVVSERGKV